MKKFILILSAISLIACKNCKNTKSMSEKTTNVAESSSTQNNVFDVIVSFISKGAGIDDKLKTTVEETVASFNKSNNTNIEAEVRHWGREGETDLNYNLKNLSTKQKNSFVALMKETVGHTDMVHLKFNEEGVQKR